MVSDVRSDSSSFITFLHFKIKFVRSKWPAGQVVTFSFVLFGIVGRVGGCVLFQVVKSNGRHCYEWTIIFTLKCANLHI